MLAASLRAARTTEIVGSMDAVVTGRGRTAARIRMSSGAPT